MKHRVVSLSCSCLLFALLVTRPVRADERWTLVGVQDGLLDRTIHCLVPSLSGGLWVGTSRGLSHWDGQRFVSYGAGNGLPEGHITALAQDGEGLLWVGSWGGGLAVLQGSHWRRYSASDSPLPGDWIAGLATTESGLWIATYGRGLANLHDGRWSSYTRANSELPSDWLTCLLPDGEGGLWVGTERAGLAHLDAQGHWRRYLLPAPPPCCSLGRGGRLGVRAVGEGPEITALGRRAAELWVGTPNGVAILDLRSGSWQLLDRSQGLPGSRVMAFAAASDSRLMWVGTDRGLVRWDDGQLTTYTVRDGLPHDVISALAVDAGDRLWVGTPVRGLAVEGHLALPHIARPPVILVHGWRGPDSDLLEDSEFWHLASWLREDGFAPYYATGISPANTLHTNALRLREVIAQARRETNSSNVYIVAFSMGGLNARAYLESTLYQGDVSRAFLLGTPHRGEELWQPLLLWEYLAWTNEPSALELMPVQAELFNLTHDNTWGVPYTLIAGDVGKEAPSSGPGLPTLFRELPPSDGLVSTWSALGPEGRAADRRITQDIHAWSKETILLNLPSLLLPRTTYDAHIRPYLFGMSASTSGEDAPGMGSPFGDSGYSRPEPEPRTAFRAGTIQPGESVTLPSIPLDTTGRARFYVRWKGPAPQVSLRDPQGLLIDADRATDNGKAEYLELGFADFASFVLTDTLPGPWRVILSADEQNAVPSQYVAYASFPSPVRLQCSTERTWYRPGEQVVISATIDDPETLAAMDEVSVEVYNPHRQLETTLALTPTRAIGLAAEAGLHYTGSFVPHESGYYTLLLQALGRRGKYVLERGESLLVGVAGTAAQLTGHFALTPGHRAVSGQLEDLEATVGFTVRQEGDYLCSLTLTDPLSRRVTTLAHPLHLLPGEHHLTIPFPGQVIAASGLDGPYRLSEVTLLDISGPSVLLDSARDAATSTALEHGDFVNRH